MSKPQPHPASDPTVTVVVWSGPLTALAARLGMTPAALKPALSRMGHQAKGHLRVEVTSPVAMSTFKRLLHRPPDETV